MVSLSSRIFEGIRKEIPLILATTGCVGFVTSTILAVKATPAANDILKQHDAQTLVSRSLYGVDRSDLEHRYEQFKIVAPIYAPAIALSLISAACVVASTTIATHRYSALTGLYVASERRLGRLQGAVLEKVSEETYEEIKESMAKTAMVEALEPPMTSDEEVLYFDTWSGRYFTVPTVETFRGIVNDVNEELVSAGIVTLNEFYYDLDMDRIPMGDEQGWSLEGGMLKIDSVAMLTEKGDPCIAITYQISPRDLYSRYGGGHLG